MRAIKALILSAVILLGGGYTDAVTAHPRPIIKGVFQGYRCEQVKGKYLTLDICGDSSVQWARPAIISLWLEKAEPVLNITQPLHTTVVVMSKEVLNPNYSGAYFPSTGLILMKEEPNGYVFLYIMLHEVLHAYWAEYEPGVPFSEHHNRIYCEDYMIKIEKGFTKALAEKGYWYNWRPDTVITKMCGEVPEWKGKAE